jgi:hypothetical protein
MSHRPSKTDGGRPQPRFAAIWLALWGALAAVSICSGAAWEANAALVEPRGALREVRRPEAQHRDGSALETLSLPEAPGLARYLVAGLAGAFCAYGLTRLIWSGNSQSGRSD